MLTDKVIIRLDEDDDVKVPIQARREIVTVWRSHLGTREWAYYKTTADESIAELERIRREEVVLLEEPYNIGSYDPMYIGQTIYYEVEEEHWTVTVEEAIHIIRELGSEYNIIGAGRFGMLSLGNTSDYL